MLFKLFRIVLPTTLRLDSILVIYYKYTQSVFYCFTDFLKAILKIILFCQTVLKDTIIVTYSLVLNTFCNEITKLNLFTIMVYEQLETII